MQNALLLRPQAAKRADDSVVHVHRPGDRARRPVRASEARERGIPVKTYTVPMHDVDRAITDGEDDGFVKIHVREGTDTILGATIVARHAGEMINEISLAMVAGIGLRTVARVIHTYPTQAEAIKKAADAYARSRRTPWLSWLLRRWVGR